MPILFYGREDFSEISEVRAYRAGKMELRSLDFLI